MPHLTDDHLYQGAPKALTPIEQMDTDLADDELTRIVRLKTDLMQAAYAAFPHTDMDSLHARAAIEELFDDCHTADWRKYDSMASACWSRDIPTYHSMLVKERNAKAERVALANKGVNRFAAFATASGACQFRDFEERN